MVKKLINVGLRIMILNVKKVISNDKNLEKMFQIKTILFYNLVMKTGEKVD
jgi:hypothetical protein